MPVTRQILKVIRGQAVVKFLSAGGGTGNVSLAELAKSDETFLGYGNANVTISGIFNTIDSMANISRNGSNVMIMAAGQQDKWDFTQSWGFSLNDNANANVYVTFSGNGSIILVLNKVTGFQPPSRLTHVD